MFGQASKAARRAALEIALWQATPMRHCTKQEHTMATSIGELEAKVLNLPAAERSRLLDRLLASLDQGCEWRARRRPPSWSEGLGV